MSNKARLVYWATWTACLLPAAFAIYWFFSDQFTADPFKRTMQYMGEWGLRLLVVGLALTPLRRITGWTWPVLYRRTIGLFGMFYVTLHLLAYVVLYETLDWSAILTDILKRPYIMIGMGAFVLLIPLAITSTNGMVRRMGSRNWLRLHRLAYAIPLLGALHYYLLVKLDTTWPLFYAATTVTLLTMRAIIKQKRRRKKGQGSALDPFRA